MTDKLSPSGGSWLHSGSISTKTGRSKRGSGMLVLITAVTVGLVLGLIFFGLNFVRLVGSGAEQKKAIEAAALAASNDLSRMVINTNAFGYVSISDSAPVGKTTEAGDNFFLQVKSINTLIGTARMEKMLASAIPPDPGDALNFLANQDLTNAQAAGVALEKILAASLAPGGSGSDINGNPVTPYADALAAYQANAQRISGQSTYVPNSLALTIGQSTQALATNIPVPVTAVVASGIPGAAGQINNMFKSNVDVPFAGNDYVFMAVGSSSALLDPKNFVATIAGLPYQYPCIVQASAQQAVTQTNNQNPGGSTIYSAACAEPASIYDPLPAPGAMSFSFPDGMIPEIVSPNTVLTNAQLNSTNLPNDSSDLFTSSGGDYPSDAAATMSGIPWFAPNAGPPNPAIGVVARAALFDWFRRAGTKAKIDSVLAQLAAPFNPSTTAWHEWLAQVPPAPPAPPVPPPPPAPPPVPPPVPTFPTTTIPPVDVGMKIPEGMMHIYKFAADGTVNHTTQNIQPFPYAVASQNQFYAVSYSAFVSKDPAFPLTSPTVSALASAQPGKWGWWGSGNATVTLTQTWDVFVRDECRQPGTLLGGKHAGEPLANAQVALLPQSNKNGDIAYCADKGGSGSGAHQGGGGGQGPGLGAVPILTEQDGWGRNMWPYESANGNGSVYIPYQTGPAAGDIRPTYSTNGEAFDIRFRRQVTMSSGAAVAGVGQIGYLGDVGP